MNIIKTNSSSIPECISRIDKESFLVRWGTTPLIIKDEVGNEIEVGYESFESVIKSLPYDINKIRSVILNHYNDKCNQEILSGLTYEGSLVWLSSENQFNYKAAFDFAFQTVASGGEFIPVTVKLSEEDTPVYKTFSDITELQEFMTSCLTHIQNTLSKYWEIKDNIDWSKYEI